MVDKYTDDKAKYRSGEVTYTIEDKIGRADGGIDKTVTTYMVVSGTMDLLPLSPLGRRDYINVVNSGAVIVEVFTSLTSSGISIAASGDSWEDSSSS